MYYGYGTPVVKVRAKELLEYLLKGKVQFYKVIHENELWAINSKGEFMLGQLNFNLTYE